MKSLQKILLGLLLAGIVSKACLIAFIAFSPRIISENNDVSAEELVNLTNEYRLNNGLEPLSVNARLTQAAVNKAKDMFEHDYFDHTSPDGKRFSQWIKELGYQYFYVGENLAIDFDTAGEIFSAWIESPAHRENILRAQFTDIGIAAMRGKYKNRLTLAVVQMFGTRIDNEDAETQPAAGPIANAAIRLTPIDKWLSIDLLSKITVMNYWLNYLIIAAAIFWLMSVLPAGKSSDNQPGNNQ